MIKLLNVLKQLRARKKKRLTKKASQTNTAGASKSPLLIHSIIVID